jgi:hypothetical protein
MQETTSRGHQIMSDGVTVWVNGPDGCSVARFGRAGIDIHRPFEEQRTQGACLFCTHAETTYDDWKLFRQKVREFFAVTVDRRHCPKRFVGGALRGVAVRIVVLDDKIH